RPGPCGRSPARREPCAPACPRTPRTCAGARRAPCRPGPCSTFPATLHQTEGGPLQARLEVALVGHSGEDLHGKGGKERLVMRAIREVGLALDDDAVGEELVADGERALARARSDEGEAHLVDGDPEVVDLFEGEADTAGNARRQDSR